MAGLGETLNDLARVQGVKAVVVVGRDGFIIDGVVTNEELDVDAVAAMVASGFGASERVGRELSVGEMSQAAMEYDKGVLVMSLLPDDAVLACIADLTSNLGNIRYQLKKRTSIVAAAL
jgi:predicted regulator of Ras-like GTPase activity (Roadblock/LC7/MglB family)